MRAPLPKPAPSPPRPAPPPRRPAPRLTLLLFTSPACHHNPVLPSCQAGRVCEPMQCRGAAERVLVPVLHVPLFACHHQESTVSSRTKQAVNFAQADVCEAPWFAVRQTVAAAAAPAAATSAAAAAAADNSQQKWGQLVGTDTRGSLGCPVGSVGSSSGKQKGPRMVAK